MKQIAIRKHCADETKKVKNRQEKEDEIDAQKLRDDIDHFNGVRQSIRPEVLYWDYDVPWLQFMEHFVHRRLLKRHIRAWGLARMLHAENADKGRFAIYKPFFFS